MRQRGVYMLRSGPRAVRAVFYLDVASDEAERALAIIMAALRVLPARADAEHGGGLRAAPSNTCIKSMSAKGWNEATAVAQLLGRVSALACQSHA